MAITIKTTFHGPTNYKGSRVSAETIDQNPASGRKDRATVSYDYDLTTIEEHKRAAMALAVKAGFVGIKFKMISGWERGFLWSSYVGNEEDNFCVAEKGALEE